MKNFLSNKFLKTLIYILSIIVFVKLTWTIIAYLFLPTSGVEHIKNAKLKPLYYRIKLARKLPHKKEPQKVVKIVKKAPSPVVSMRGIKLLAIYNSKEILVVTVSKNRKSKVLSKGEDIDGFKLVSAGRDYAIFKKNNREFKLSIEGSKIKNPSSIKIVKERHNRNYKNHSNNKNRKIIKRDDGERVISKGLLTSYTKDIDKVWKDIGIGEHKKNGVLDGFIVNFVKKGSDFDKLGLKRGDILKSINGEELNSYNSAFSFYKEIENIDSLTLGIIRNNQEMELEYEIN